MLERLEKLELTTLREKRMRGDLIETLQIINGIPNYGRHFLIFPLKLKICCQGRFQKLILLQLNFFANRVIYSWYNHLIRSKTKKKILRLNRMISEKEFKLAFFGSIRWIT